MKKEEGEEEQERYNGDEEMVAQERKNIKDEAERKGDKKSIARMRKRRSIIIKNIYNKRGIWV